MYEALRQMTKERARAVVESSGYDGFEAWHRLCIHFQPNADAQAAALGGELIKMGSSTAKTYAETWKLVSQFDETNYVS